MTKEVTQEMNKVNLRVAIVKAPFSDFSGRYVSNYLPANYEVIGKEGDGILIAGRDDKGWTLDDYIIPRLGSGLMACKEICVKT